MLGNDFETYPRRLILPDTSVCGSSSSGTVVDDRKFMQEWAGCPAVVMNTGRLMEQGWVNA